MTIVLKRRLTSIKRLKEHKPKFDPSMYIGSSAPDILFVVDPVIGPPGADNPPNAKAPLNRRQSDFLADYCNKHAIPRNKAAITSACPPVTREVWDSEKKLSDHIKLHRQKLVDIVSSVKPKLIVTLGKAAARSALNRAVQITKLRGVPVDNEELNCTIFPTLGINHVMRIPEVERTFDTDFAILKKICDADFKSEYQEKLETDYRWMTNLAPLLRLADKGKIEVALDTEYTGGEYYHKSSRLLTVQVCTRPGKAYAIPIDYNLDNQLRKPDQAMRSKIVRQLKRFLEHPNVHCFGQNLKGDLIWLRWKLGIEVRNFCDDTILLMHRVDENMPNKSLDDIVRQFVPEMSGYADAFNVDPIHQKKTRMDLVGPADMLSYGCGDADATYRSRDALLGELQKDPKNYRAYRKVAMPAIRAFTKIEDHGFPVDIEALRSFEKSLRAHQEAEYKRLVKMVPKAIREAELGPKFQTIDRKTGKVIKKASITRPGFLRAFLFTHPRGLRLKPIVFTKSTRGLKNEDERVPSTSAKDHLVYFKEDHEFIAPIMEYIKNEKLLGTYVGSEDGGDLKGFYRYIYEGRIRPTYLLHRAVTGRTSSANPNGQNFPKRGKLAKEYRKIFKAPPGYVFLEVDFSQMELRIAAIMANDRTMLDLYRRGADIHAATAARVMGISLDEFNELDEVTKAQKRFEAKAVNFGFLYGMGWRKFITYAKTTYDIEFTEEEAQHIQKAFFSLYRSLKPWHNAVMAYARKNGYVRSFDGSVRHLPNVNSPDEFISSAAERQAINSPVQGFGSNLGLMALHLIVKNVSFDLVRPIGFIHDALVCLAPAHKAKEAAGAVKHWMENIPLKKMFNFDPPIPIIAEAAVGQDLSKMIEIKDSWFADDNVSSYRDLQIIDWKARCAKAERMGEEAPPHPFKKRLTRKLKAGKHIPTKSVKRTNANAKAQKAPTKIKARPRRSAALRKRIDRYHRSATRKV